MKELRVGCPIWANRDWVGPYFPPDTVRGRELAAYASWCTAVEGNTTFYSLPAAETVTRWAEQTPESFRFVCKLPRAITHDDRLRGDPAAVGEFVERLSPLGERLGPLWVQLPASFGPEDLGTLGAFLAHRAGEHRWAVEVRHPAFSAGGPEERAVNDLLYAHSAERVLIDTRALFDGPAATGPEIEAFERKPRLPVRPVAIGPEPMVRFIGQTEPSTNPAFWRPWVAKIAEWIEDGRRPTFFLHTPDNRYAPELARQFHAEVTAVVPDLAPLPEPMSTDQLKLI